MDIYKPQGAKYSVQRRVAGDHDIRLDGISDLLLRANGASVFDIGCNRGRVGFEFATNGATLVHGCDIYDVGIRTAREWFADIRWVESRFEIVDLTKGPESLRAFGKKQYDIVVCLATYHKLKRVMKPADLDAVMLEFGNRTLKYFAWRGTSDKGDENMDEMKSLDEVFRPIHLRRIHTSFISNTLGAAAIWARK